MDGAATAFIMRAEENTERIHAMLGEPAPIEDNLQGIAAARDAARRRQAES